MSTNFAPRILELLRQHQYPGAERFTERDIEILTQNPIVKAVLMKFATLHPSQFLTKDQVDVLRLAGELNDPSFIPLDPVEIRKQIAELRRAEREQKRLRMQERHRREEVVQIKKVISLLEEDETLRDDVRRKHEQMANAVEVQAKKAETSLKTAQQDLQAALSMFKVEVQQTLKDMKLVVEKVKKPGGLRSLLDSEAYIAFANEIVDITEAAHSAISQPEASPHKYAVQVGNKRVAVVKTLEHMSEELEESCTVILDALRPICQNSRTYAGLEDALMTYKSHLQNSIHIFINQLFDSAAMINKGQLEKMLPILNKLEVVIFAHKSILLEENKFLEETLEMIRRVHEWKQSLLPITAAATATTGGAAAATTTTTTPNELLNASMMRSTYQHNSTMGNDMTFQPSQCLSSTMFEQQTQPPSCLNSTSCHKSALSSVGGRKVGLYPSSHFEEIIDSISNKCVQFHATTNQIEAERSVLCGASGIQFLSESDRLQLQVLSQRTIEKKAALKKLIRVHEAFNKDFRNRTRAHYKRVLIPMYILDRQKYEHTLQSIGLGMDIFQ